MSYYEEQPQLLQPNTNTVASTRASFITTSQVIDSSPIILPQSISTLDIGRQLILEFERTQNVSVIIVKL